MKIIYEDQNIRVIDKPAGITVDQFEKLVHRLDKDTSGILLISKNEKTLDFLQKQFKNQEVTKKYIALVVGNFKNKKGVIETLVGREPKKRKKQRVYLPLGPESKKEGKRLATTKYQILKKFFDGKNYYTLIEVEPKTGRKHQIRTHFAYLGYPVTGDKIYGFKNQPRPKGLNRQFLHAKYLKIRLPDGQNKEFKSDLPENLKETLKNLTIYDNKN